MVSTVTKLYNLVPGLSIVGPLPQVVPDDDPDDHRHDRGDHQRLKPSPADCVGHRPDGGDHQHVGGRGERRGDRALEAGEELPGTVGEHHPGPEPQVPARPGCREARIDVHVLHVLVGRFDPSEGSCALG